MSKLAQAVSRMEGFGIPGAKPTRFNNPGDLRHSPHSSHEGEGPNDIGKIDTPEHGWEDLELQLQKYAYRGLTLAELVECYAPPSENDTARYLASICAFGSWSPKTTVADALADG